MKKPDFSKITIKTKKDWVIFWVFAVLISYALASLFQGRINIQLRRFQNPWLWIGNEPKGYGRMIAAVVILALVTEAVCFLRRKKIWMKLIVLAAGILIPVALVGIYQYNCRLIVSVIWEQEPENILIDRSNQSYTLTAADRSEIMELCRKLTVVSDEQKQQELTEWYRSDRSSQELDRIDLHFGEKYGHNVWFWLYVGEDVLFFNRGYGPNSELLVTFFEDDGLLQYLENLKKDQVGAAK